MRKANITQVANDLVLELSKTGFKGIHFEQLSGWFPRYVEDGHDGDLAKKEFDRWLKNYACIILVPEIPLFTDESPFIEQSFNAYGFYKALTEHIKSLFHVDEISIETNKNTGEVEISRKDYEMVYRKTVP